MAAGPTYPGAVAHSKDLARVTFRIQAGATGGAEPDFVYPSDCGVTDATRDGSAGLYSVTLSPVYPGIVGGVATVLSAAATAAKSVIIDIADYNTTTGVLQVQVVQDDGDGTVTAVDLVENDWLYFDLVFVQAGTAAVTGPIP